MEFSLRTTVYYGINAVIGATALINTPKRFEWLTAFAAGIIFGTFIGNWALNAIERESVNGVVILKWNTPRITNTLLHYYALALIQKSVPANMLVSEKYIQPTVYSSAFMLGNQLANFFCLDQLKRNRAEQVVRLTANLVV